MGELEAALLLEVAAFDEPAAPPAPTVTVTVLADVTVTVAGPQAPVPAPPLTGELPLTAEIDPAPYELPPPFPPYPPAPPEIAPSLETGTGDTVTVE